MVLLLAAPLEGGRMNNTDYRSVVLQPNHSLPPFLLIESFHCPGPREFVAEIAIDASYFDSTADPIGRSPLVGINPRITARIDIILEFVFGDLLN